MDAPDGGDQFPYERPPGLEDDDELVRLLLRSLPPVPRFDRPVVGARREPSLDDDPSDRPGGLAVRRGHVSHRVQNPSTGDPISRLPSLSVAGIEKGTTTSYLVF